MFGSGVCLNYPLRERGIRLLYIGCLMLGMKLRSEGGFDIGCEVLLVLTISSVY